MTLPPPESPPSYDEVLASSLSAAPSASHPPAAPSPRPTAAAPPTPPQAPPVPPRPYRPEPTRVPRAGHPFLHKGQLLVYPADWRGCPKCGNTGYKEDDPAHLCRKCWKKYGRLYAGAVLQAYEYDMQHGTDASPILRGLVVQAPFRGPASSSADHLAPPGGLSWHAPSPPTRPSASAPPLPARRNSSRVFPEDRYNDAPPRYNLAQKPSSDMQLPQQNYPSAAATRVRPPFPPHVPWGHGAPPSMPMPHRPTMNWHGYGAPGGSVVVHPGDPRIGGVLCPRCRGTGNSDSLLSLFLGDDECGTCGGSGRVPH
ncbi:hypothetical protein MSPP1_001191 [Malassezia sp. CBS 17886]|nr:hypothetical protein MSPP1_001191 [Malassezia sp. CBS 17886]